MSRWATFVFCFIFPCVYSGSMDLGMEPFAGTYQNPVSGWPVDFDFDAQEEQKVPRDAGAVEPKDVEYLQHSSLWGHQYIQGGAGKGQQYLLPEGSIASKPEIKTDAVLPAYCDPANPCPVGYTGDDGCMEEFENSAEFNRDYQAKQDCMCDEEHMFSCPRSKVNELLDEEGDGMDEFSDRLTALLDKANINGHHKVVAKKFHAKKKKSEQLSIKDLKENPYLNGEKLKVVAKKG